MQHRDKIVLQKIVKETNIAAQILGDADFKTFNDSEMLKRSICMTAINIGELVKSLTPELRISLNHIPWKSIAGFRDVAAHKYQSLFMDDVYNVVKEDFPELKNNIQQILKDSTKEDG